MAAVVGVGGARALDSVLWGRVAGRIGGRAASSGRGGGENCAGDGLGNADLGGMRVFFHCGVHDGPEDAKRATDERGR